MRNCLFNIRTAMKQLVLSSAYFDSITSPLVLNILSYLIGIAMSCTFSCCVCVVLVHCCSH